MSQVVLSLKKSFKKTVGRKLWRSCQWTPTEPGKVQEILLLEIAPSQQRRGLWYILQENMFLQYSLPHRLRRQTKITTIKWIKVGTEPIIMAEFTDQMCLILCHH